METARFVARSFDYDLCKLALPMLLSPKDALLLEKMVINVESSGRRQSKSRVFATAGSALDAIFAVKSCYKLLTIGRLSVVERIFHGKRFGN